METLSCTLVRDRVPAFRRSGPGPFFWRQGRTGAYGGGWITSFSWLKPGVHRRLLVANPLLLAFREIMPAGAIVGLPVDNPAYHRDFLAGQVFPDCFDLAKAKESLMDLYELADVIVPGHDNLFIAPRAAG